MALASPLYVSTPGGALFNKACPRFLFVRGREIWEHMHMYRQEIASLYMIHKNKNSLKKNVLWQYF